jgi:hypothetical protein
MSDLFEYARRRARQPTYDEFWSLKTVDATGKVTAGRRILG